MFDQKPNSNQGGPLVNQPEPPANLPTSPVAGSGSVLPKPPGPEDILADVDMDASAASDQTRGPSVPLSTLGPARPAEPARPKAEIKEPFVKRNRKVFIAIFLVLILGGGLAIAGWYVYNQFVVSSPNSSVLSGEPLNQNVNQPVNQNVEPPAPLDSDRDGLTDEEESMYGTDSLKVDSDSDGLTDRDEAKVFETDPTEADTDGDGFLDGEEIRNGYDPKGSGRLFEI